MAKRSVEVEFHADRWTVEGTEAVIRELRSLGAPSNARLSLQGGGIGAEEYGSAKATWEAVEEPHD